MGSSAFFFIFFFLRKTSSIHKLKGNQRKPVQSSGKGFSVFIGDMEFFFHENGEEGIDVGLRERTRNSESRNWVSSC